MESFEINDICRICLRENVVFNWNEYVFEFSNMTYKDCYYKYTQLETLDEDPYSQMLCKKCSTDLKNSEILVVKALESHTILQQKNPSSVQIKCDENWVTKTKTETITFNLKCKPNEFEILIMDSARDRTAKKCHNLKSFQILETETLNEQQEYCKSKASTEIEKYNEPIKDQRIQRVYKKPKLLETESIDNEDEAFQEQQVYKKPKLPKNDSFKQKQQVYMKNKVKSVDKDEADELVDNSKDSIYMCSICSKTYKTKKALIAHEKNHTAQRVRTQICPHCGLKFYNKACLDLHVKTHKKNREKKHKCEFCNKAYYNGGDLTVHKRIHLGKMIPCVICPKKFVCRIDLEKHNASAHSASSINTVKRQRSRYYVYCKQCDKQLRTVSWRAHQAKHLNEPLLKCSICDKDFYSRATCTYHMAKIHDYKTREEYDQFIENINPGRLTHLLLEQQDMLITKKEDK